MDNNYEALNGNNQNENNNIALISMILGILSVVLCWIPIVGLVLGIIALVLSIKGLNQAKYTNKGKGFSIAGLSCGIVGIFLNLIYSFVWLLAFIAVKVTVNELNDLDYNPSYEYRYNNRYNSSYNRTYNYNNINNILDDYDF